jgi:hypothetical protein
MRKSFTRIIQKTLPMVLFAVVGFNALAQDLKPYPVYYPMADMIEFNYGATTWVKEANMTSMNWYNNSLNGVAVANNTTNCTGLSYITVPYNNNKAVPYGRCASLPIGYNRAMYITMKTPYLNPGTYRIYLGTCWNSTTSRTCECLFPKLDSVALTNPNDTTYRAFNSTATTTAPNKQSVKYGGTATLRHYDIYLGKATITRAGTHTLQFYSNSGGTDYAFSLLQFIPVTETDLDTDYDYPKFDNSGQVWLSASDLTTTINDTPNSGYYLPYQVSDPTVYTKYNVTLDAGLYFADKIVTVKRFEDKWTRVFVDTTDASGLCEVASLPAGKYYVEVNKGQYTTSFQVTGNMSQYVGVSTANINVTYSPELWYIGKTFQCYNSTGQILLKELVIPETGVLPTFALPVDTNKYIYYVVNYDGTTHFEEGTISVPSTETVNLDKTATKYQVTLNLGNDLYGNNQPYTIVNSTNSDALYISSTSDASGNCTALLPNGSYYFASTSGLILSTFTVSDAPTTIDLTARHTANFCLGKTMAGANVDVYLSSTGVRLYQFTIPADGKISCPGLTNGRFYHNVYRLNGADTTWYTTKFTFVIDGTDFDLGNCDNMEQPYYLPYPVYFDMCNQPEITWMTNQTFQPGDLQYFKFDKHPTDTVYTVIDTVWTSETTYVVNYDSTSISSITYWDYNCHYGFNGITYDKVDNCYVWGDIMYFRFPAKGKLTIVTPNLNPGRYNVYMSNRWAPGRTGSGNIDTCYMDGLPLLTTDGVVRTFSATASDYTNGMQAAGLLRNMNAANLSSYTLQQGSLFMGEALVTTPGRHDFSLYSIAGATTSGDYGGAWWNMIYFIPVDVDSLLPTDWYIPRIDFCGNLVNSNTSAGATTLGTDGVNRATYIGQFTDPTVLSSDAADYSKTLTVNGGAFSLNETLTHISPIDDWTIKQAATDSQTGIASIKVAANANPATWVMENEHVTGEAILSDNVNITIPESIDTYINSTYSYEPDVADPEMGMYSLTSTVTLANSYPFYYPITGVVTYSLDGEFLKAGGDTIYEATDKTLNGIAPVLSQSMPISDSYLFLSSYGGNGTRLQSSMNEVLYTKLKGVEVSAGVWPNPASERVNLRLNKNEGVATYTLYNQLGQVVRNSSFTGAETSFSLRGVQKGLYILRVKAGGEVLKTKLIVK